LDECKEALRDLRLLCGGALQPGDVGELVSLGEAVEPCFDVLYVMSKKI
jgi:hypothetical protein